MTKSKHWVKTAFLPWLISALTISLFFTFPAGIAWADNLSVSDYQAQQVTGEEVTVTGYVTGSLNSSGSDYISANTNLALGQTPDAQAPDTVPVQLPKALRDQYGLESNPNLQGQYVSVTGQSANYMGRPGVRSATAVTLLESPQPETSVTVPEVSNNEQPVTPTTPETTEIPLKVTPIATVRNSPQEASYTVAGKIISKVNAWGNQGFYIQDNSGQGLYIFPKSKTSLGYNTGDSVQLTGTLTNYRGELQLGSLTDHKRITAQFDTPITETTIPHLAQDSQATLVTLKDLTIKEFNSDTYNNANLVVTDKEGNSLAVRLDSRSGIKASDLLTITDVGDTLNITGVLSTFDGTIQLKPFEKSHFDVTKKAERSLADKVGVTVADVQGKSHQSPYMNRPVTLKDVVVTYVTADNNFYVQDVTPDKDPATSDGINIFSGNLKTKVKVGDLITVDGVVEEYFGRGYEERKKTDLTITQLKATAITVTGSGTVPAPIVIGKDRHIPKDIVDNDAFGNFDPEEDALDFWESIEGMLVAVDDAKILGPMKNKEIYVVPGNSTSTFNKVGGITLRPNATNTELIPLLLKSGETPVKSGDYFTGRITGPVTYSYTNYKVYVDDATLPRFHQGTVTPETTHIVKDPNQLTIASYNIENFSADPESTKDSKVERIAKSFVSDLNAPDIIGLVEVQDNNGPKNDGTTDATESANRLIQAIKAQGGPSYLYTDIAPENNRDGGQAGANIRLGFLYNPERVSLSNKPKGDALQAIQWQNGKLSLSVGRIAPTNPIWEGVRKSLAAEFIFQGKPVVVVANHLNSKRGDNGSYGSIQPVTLQSEPKRHKLAKLLAQFAQDGLAQNPNAAIVMLGDFNDYEFTQTLKLIEAGGMSNLVSLHDASDRFSYFYNGNNQSLDHMLVSNNLLGHYTFDMVHVNSAFMEVHGRASDHDPLLLQLSFPSAETPDSGKTETPKSENQPAPSTGTNTTETTENTETTIATGSAKTSTHKEPLPAKHTPSRKAKLPLTGEQVSYLLIIIGCGVVLIVITMVIKRKK